MEESEVDRGAAAQATGPEQEEIKSPPVGDLPHPATPFATGENETTDRVHDEVNCGRRTAPLEAKMQDGQELKVIVCPDCKTELYPWRHRFCFGCGKKVEQVVPNSRKHEGSNASINPLAFSSKTEPHPGTVVIGASRVEQTKQDRVGGSAVGSGDVVTESLQRSPPSGPMQSVSAAAKTPDLQIIDTEERPAEKLGHRSLTNVLTSTKAAAGSIGLGSGKQNGPGFHENAENTKLLDELAVTKDNEVVLQAKKVEGLKGGETLVDAKESKKDGSTHPERIDHSAKSGQNRADIAEDVGSNHDAAAIVAAECKQKTQVGTDANAADKPVEVDKQDKTEVRGEQHGGKSNLRLESNVHIQNSMSNEDGDKNKTKFPAENLDEGTVNAENMPKCVGKEGKDDGKGEKAKEKLSEENDGLEEDDPKVTAQSNSESVVLNGGTSLIVSKIEKKEGSEPKETGKVATDKRDEAKDQISHESKSERDPDGPETSQTQSKRRTADEGTTEGGMEPNDQMQENAKGNDGCDLSFSDNKDGKVDKNVEKRPTEEENEQRKGSVEKKSSSADTSAKLCDLAKDHASKSGVLPCPVDKKAQKQQSGYFYQKENRNEEYMTRKKGNAQNQLQLGKNQTSGGSFRGRENNVERTMTVVFHAMLSEKFERGNDTEIFIRGAEPTFRGWKCNCVRMLPLRTVDNSRVLLRGETKVLMKFVRRKVPYKYVIVTNGEVHYEEVIEFMRWRAITDRCLVIPEAYANESATWDKFDGFIYPHPGRMRRLLGSGIQYEDRRAFFRACFPKWRGFHVITHDCDVEPVAAVKKVDNLVNGVLFLYTSTSGFEWNNSVPSCELNISEVMREFFTPKIRTNLAVISGDTTNALSVVDAVLSTIVIVHIFARHDVSLPGELQEVIFRCMKLPPKEAICSAIMEEMDKFGDNVLSAVADSVCKLFVLNRLTKSPVVHWLQALPLLHFLRRNSRPFVDVDVRSIKYDNWEWWGLKTMNVRSIRREITESEAKDMLPELSKLFRMDRLLPRSFMILVPIETYRDLLRTDHFSVLELCITLRRILPEKDSTSYTRDFRKCLSDLFREVDRKLASTSVKDLTKGHLAKNEALMRTFVTLMQNVKQYLELSDMGILCRITECLITLIQLHSNGTEYQNSAGGNDDEGRSELHIPFADIPGRLLQYSKEAFRVVNKYLESKCRLSLQYCPDEDLHSELQVGIVGHRTA